MVNQDRVMGMTHRVIGSELKGPVKLALVLPCFNEEEGLAVCAETLNGRLSRWRAAGLIAHDSFVVLVDDGSSDATWSIIQRLAAESGAFCGVKLSKNYGHQAAVLAGLDRARRSNCDVAISLDADLQQNIDAVPEFLEQASAGADIVLGVRNDRATDSAAKRTSGEFFYWVMRRCGVKLVRNHADYRLLSKRALDALARFPESNVFLRGLVHELGLRTAIVHFDVREREFGKSKYNLLKMLRLALDGITSFSTVPLRMVTALGFVVTVGAFGMIGYVLLQRLLFSTALPGWASTVLPIYFLGGIQLLCLGILGEYVGRIYFESKRRPRFLIEDEVN